jgi:hypothetical protein
MIVLAIIGGAAIAIAVVGLIGFLIIRRLVQELKPGDLP